MELTITVRKNNRSIALILFAAVSAAIVLVPFIFFIPGFPYNMIRYVHLVAEFVAVVVAIYCYPSLKDSFMKWFLPFHIFILLEELLAFFFYYKTSYAYRPFSESPPRQHIMYLTSIAASVFYGYIFYHLAVGRYAKTQIRVLMQTVVMAELLYYGLYMLGIAPDFSRNLYGLTGFPICLVALLYLYEVVKRDDVLLLRDPGFWLALGLCTFYSGISISVMTVTHSPIKFRWFSDYVTHIIIRALCVMLYGCTCVAMVKYAGNLQGHRDLVNDRHKNEKTGSEGS